MAVTLTLTQFYALLQLAEAGEAALSKKAPSARLSDAQRERIDTLLADGRANDEIARETGATTKQVAVRRMLFARNKSKGNL